MDLRPCFTTSTQHVPHPLSRSSAFDLSKSRSQIGEDTIAAFLANDVEADLESVPGVGPANRDALQKAGYMTTAALLGLFLTLHDDEDSCQAHLDKYVHQLRALAASRPEATHRACFETVTGCATLASTLPQVRI